MIGKPGAQLNRFQLDVLCEDRKVGLRQKTIASRDSILEKIEDNANADSNPCDAYIAKLPYDAWEHVLKDVSEPKEITKLWNVSDDFRETLRNRYIETKLPEIIDWAVNFRPNYFLSPFMYNSKQSYIKSTLLNLRLMSKQCKKSFDAFLHSMSMDVLQVNCTEKLQKISENLREDPSHVASFFTASIVIDEQHVSFLNGRDRDVPFHAEVKIFLGLVGGRIHSLTYIPYQKKRVKIYDNLREWVVLMPNLEKLSLTVKRGYALDFLHKRIQTLKPEEIRSYDYIERFPSCPKLRCFECAWQLLPAHFIRRIVEVNAFIRDLHLSEEALATEHEHSPQILGSLADLMTLRISPDFSFLSRHYAWKKLNRLVLANPSSSGPMRTAGKISIAAYVLFPILGQFEDTLEHLELLIEVIGSSDGEYLPLKNLKTLKWDQHASFKNVNFLLYAEKLETLHIIPGNMMDNYGYGLFGQYCYYPNACHCMRCYRDMLVGDRSGGFLGKSVWQVFPYLKWIWIGKQYRRDSFMRRPRPLRI